MSSHHQAAILVLCTAAMAAAASGDAIGSVNVYGSARLGSADAPTGATVFEGQTLATANRSRALVTLASAASISLGPNSEATLRRSAVSLARGAARFQADEAGTT